MWATRGVVGDAGYAGPGNEARQRDKKQWKGADDENGDGDHQALQGRRGPLLQSKGRPIPTNDIWIAAHAMESGADLLSFDPRFESVDGLAWVRLPAT